MEDQDSIFSDIKTTEVESSNSQKFLANLIDWGVEILVLVAIYLFLSKQIFASPIGSKPYFIYLLIFVSMFAYRLISILLLGKTIGMMVCRLKYLNSSYKPLTTKDKFIAALAVQTRKIRSYKATQETINI